MKRLDNNQSGFIAIPIVIIGIVMASLVGGGVYYQKRYAPERKQAENVEELIEEATSSATPSMTPTPSPKLLDAVKEVVPLQPNPSPSQEAHVQAPHIQTYRILSLSELVNLNGANSDALSSAYSAYNIFLQTSDLIYLSPTEQQQVFVPILEGEINKSLNQQKTQLQYQIDTMEQAINNLNNSQQSVNNTQVSEAYQSCVVSKIEVINNNPFLSESSRQAQVSSAYQECSY